jgi:hypothetical protein
VKGAKGPDAKLKPRGNKAAASDHDFIKVCLVALLP